MVSPINKEKFKELLNASLTNRKDVLVLKTLEEQKVNLPIKTNFTDLVTPEKKIVNTNVGTRVTRK